MVQPRKKGSGTIFERHKTFFWQIKVDGKRKTIRLKARTRDHAEKESRSLMFAASITNEAETALFVARSKKLLDDPKEMTFSESFMFYKRSAYRPFCSPAWIEQKKRIWTKFGDAMNCVSPNQVSEHLVSLWIRSLQKCGLSNKTINIQVGIVKSIYAVIDPQTTIFQKIPKLPVSPNGLKDFSVEQVKDIFLAIDGKMQLVVPHREEMKILFRLAAYTGLRLKDCCLFTWENVQLERNLINCIPWKTLNSSAKSVWIPIHPTLRSHLDYARSLKHNGYVLPEVAAWYSHDRTRPDRVCRRVIHWALWDRPAAGRRPPKADGYGFHSFRHSFASFCAKAGVPVDFVREILGQTSVSTTRYYVHLPSSVLDQVITALPDLSKHDHFSEN